MFYLFVIMVLARAVEYVPGEVIEIPEREDNEVRLVFGSCFEGAKPYQEIFKWIN